MAFEAIHDARLFSISIDDNGLGEFKVDLHDIGWAVRQLQAGKMVYRTGWNGQGLFLTLMEPDETTDVTLPYVVLFTAQNETVPWLCSQTDLLAEDWEVRKH